MPKKTTKKAKSTETKEATTRVVTGKVLATFVHLVEPDNFGTEPKYTITAVVPNSDKKTVKALKDAVKLAMKDEKLAGKNLKKIKNPIKDGNDEDLEKYPYYEDTTVVTFKTNKKPTVLSRSKRVLDSTDDIYSGMFVAISGVAYAYANKESSGVTFLLGGVMKLEDGERLGGGGFDLDSDFEEFAEEDEDGFDEVEDEEDFDDEEEEEEEDEEDEESEDVYELSDLKVLLKKAKAKSKKKVASLYDDYEIEKLSELDEDDYNDFAEELNDIIG